MLIKGLGRVEGTVEDLQPVTLKQLIPLDLLDSFIGIYWHVGKGKFIIYKAPLLDAKYAVVEMGQDYDEQSNTDDLQIDYNVFHMDIWYEDVLKKYPEFTGCEFDYFSRGRILYEVQQRKFVIYGSKKLLNSAKAVEFLAQEFSTNAARQKPCVENRGKTRVFHKLRREKRKAPPGPDGPQRRWNAGKFIRPRRCRGRRLRR